MIVKIAAAARDDRALRLRTDYYTHGRFRIGLGGPSEEPPPHLDPTLGEEVLRFSERALDQRQRHGWVHVDGHLYCKHDLKDARREEKARLHGATL